MWNAGGATRRVVGSPTRQWEAQGLIAPLMVHVCVLLVLVDECALHCRCVSLCMKAGHSALVDVCI